MSVELVRGAYRYRLAHAYRGGGLNVLDEVTTVPALERLLTTYARLSLADLTEEPDAG